MKKFLIGFLIVYFMLVFAGIAGAVMPKSQSDELFSEMCNAGVVTDYDKYGNYYINHNVWIISDYKFKKGLLWILAHHNHYYNNNKLWAVAFSDRTGKKLAKISEVFGMKVY